MYYLELIKRIVPFFITFAVGIILTSLLFGAFALIFPSKTEVKEFRFESQTVERPSYEYRGKRSCKKRYKDKRKYERREYLRRNSE